MKRKYNLTTYSFTTNKLSPIPYKDDDGKWVKYEDAEELIDKLITVIKEK